MTQSPSASPSSTSHSTVPWAKSLMSRSTATPQPSIIIPVWPVGTNDGRVAGRLRGLAAARGRPTSCRSRSRCRPSGSPACPARAAGRRPSPSARAAAGSRRSAVPARGRRGRELRVVAEERVQAGQHVEPGARSPRGSIARHAAGSLPPVGAMPISSASGGLGSASASSSVATIGMSWPGRNVVDVLPGLRRIEDGDDVVAPVADDAVRGLGVVGAELALGEDDEPSGCRKVAFAESTETSAVPERGNG